MREKRQQKQPVELKGGKTAQEKHTQEKKKKREKKIQRGQHNNSLPVPDEKKSYTGCHEIIHG